MNSVRDAVDCDYIAKHYRDWLAVRRSISIHVLTRDGVLNLNIIVERSS